MAKFDLGGKVMDEFARIAIEKGWIVEAQDDLTPQRLEQDMTSEQAITELKQMMGQKSDNVEAAMSKEKNLTKICVITNELLSLANDLDSMGETEAANIVDKQFVMFKEAADKLYDITGETGEKFIGSAHPGGGVTIAPAKDEGGKIETVVEQQKKDIDIANKNPTGKYAETIMKLIATADRLENEGNVEAAEMVDKAIEELRQAALPFVNRNSTFGAVGSKDEKALTRKAFDMPTVDFPKGSGVAGGVAGGAAKTVGKAVVSGVAGAARGIAAGFGTAAGVVGVAGTAAVSAALLIPAITNLTSSWWSQSETISTDIKDLLDYAKGLSGQDAKIPPLVQRLEQQLTPFMESLRSETFGLDYLSKNPQQIQKIAQTYAQFGTVLADADRIVNMIGGLAEEWTWNPRKMNPFFNLHKRIVSKLNDLKKSYGQQYAIFQELVKGVQQQAGTGGKNEGKGEGTEKMRQEQYGKYIGTLDKLINAIGKNPRGLMAAFGNKNDKVVDEFMKGLKEEKKLAEKYNWKQLMDNNDAIYNRLIPFLKKYRVSVADRSYNFVKRGEGLADLLKNIPEQPKAKGKAAPGKGKGVARAPKDPQVEALQTALNSAGITVGVDGFWGPNTAKAYNAFIDKNEIELKGKLTAIPNPERQRHANRPTAIIPKAINTIKYMSGMEKEIGLLTIPLNGGINVSLEAMTSPQSFVNYMHGLIGSQTFLPDAALQYLEEIRLYVNENAVEMEGKQVGAARMWQAATAELVRKFQQFERQAKGNQKFQYPWGGTGGSSGGQAGGGQQGQAGGVKYLGFGGDESTQVDWRNLKTLDDIKNAANSLPLMSGLTYERFQDIAGSRDQTKQKEVFDKISNNLTLLVGALSRARAKYSEDPYFVRIWNDTGDYRTALENLRRSLRF